MCFGSTTNPILKKKTNMKYIDKEKGKAYVCIFKAMKYLKI